MVFVIVTWCRTQWNLRTWCSLHERGYFYRRTTEGVLYTWQL